MVDTKISAANLRVLRAYSAEIDSVEEPDPESGEFLQARLNPVRELLAAIEGSLWPNQYANLQNPVSHYSTTMQEIATALDDKVDFLFVATSTCGTVRGCVEYVRHFCLDTRVIAVDALGSLIFNDVKAKRVVPGLGAGLRPPLCESREAILADGSSGGVLAAVERLQERIPEGANCVAILPDRGERYLETLFDDGWVREHLGTIEHLWREPLKEMECKTTASWS